MGSNTDEYLGRFLAEDVRSGDATSGLLPQVDIRAQVVAREEGVVAGVGFARRLFELGGASASVVREDGSGVGPGDVVLVVSGSPYAVLSSERTALNLLSRMSGIATRTRTLMGLIGDCGVQLLATRKTAPGLRYFDKRAVEIGGGLPHRMALDDMILLKDNHLAAGAVLEEIIPKAKGTRLVVEVEVESVADAVTAARCGADIIMLDNLEPEGVIETIRELKSRGLRDGVKIEASGGIDESNIAEYAMSGVDMISSGSLTASVRGIDFGLDI